MKIRFPDNRPPGSWKRLVPFDVPVAEVQQLRVDVEAFALGADRAAASGWAFGVTLRRDSGNWHDPNAIAVDGFWTAPRRRWLRRPVSEKRNAHVGFVPVDVAAKVAPMLDAGETVVADVRSWYVSMRGFSDLKIGLYEPSQAAVRH